MYGHNLHYLHVSDICKWWRTSVQNRYHLISSTWSSSKFGGGLQLFGKCIQHSAQMACSSAAFIHEESTKFQSQPGNRNEPRVINLHLPSWKVWMAFFEPRPEAVSGGDCGGRNAWFKPCKFRQQHTLLFYTETSYYTINGCHLQKKGTGHDSEGNDVWTKLTMRSHTVRQLSNSW